MLKLHICLQSYYNQMTTSWDNWSFICNYCLTKRIILLFRQSELKSQQ